MAAVASPTPASLISSFVDQPYRRAASRDALRPTRRPFPGRLSPQFVASTNFASSDMTPAAADSSDDEDLAPIKLSAEAQAILGEDSSNVPSSGNRSRIENRAEKDILQGRNHVESELSKRLPRSSISPNRGNGSPAPRVVRVPSAPRPMGLTTMARDGSFMYKIKEKASEPVNKDPHESRTPGSNLRIVRVGAARSHTRSPPSTLSAGKSVGSSSSSAGSARLRKTASPESGEDQDDGGIPTGPSTITRPRRGDENGVHSTMRVKRVGRGTYLTGPVRRGMIRRQSDEDGVSVYHELDAASTTPEVEVGRNAPQSELDDNPDNVQQYEESPQRRQNHMPFIDSLYKASRSPALPINSSSNIASHSAGTRSSPHLSAIGAKSTPVLTESEPQGKSSSAKTKPTFKIPSLPPIYSSNDQENEPPPTFKRPKGAAAASGDLQISELPAEEKPPNRPVRVSASPQRQPLATRSENTPHRSAPAPPPKMSILEAATSAAGSARNKKIVSVTVNEKNYRRLDCIGRGGSSRVYRIMAENFKIFALKRVNLEDADMAAIVGYKGEIDLLRKLENVDRVVRLFDFEVNEKKGFLNVIMELGESDFNKMLDPLKAEDAKLDITFTRYYWKEMLECVQAVHDHGIVHSDLKPANFLLVKGKLKLIDFGIANAIQDNTVNVHRDNQIGTPNYMSPESLVAHTPAIGAPGGKVLKLGKPSDVWSLGCILYQMTYGQPPFAYITKQFEKIMSIPNPKVEIQFPGTGVGGVVVPFGLIKTLKKCLQREQSLRPTIQELLGDSDPFLNPVAISPDMLGRMISNVIGYCRRKEEAMRSSSDLVGPSPIPTDADMHAWPWAFYEKLKQAQEDGTAW